MCRSLALWRSGNWKDGPLDSDATAMTKKTINKRLIDVMIFTALEKMKYLSNQKELEDDQHITENLFSRATRP
jgi:hypothetical protein